MTHIQNNIYNPSHLNIFCRTRLHTLTLPVHIGVGDEERRHTQNIVIDCEVKHQVAPMGLSSDKITDTVCYHTMAQVITATATHKPRALLEHLAFDIILALKEHFSEKLLYRIVIHKPNAPVEHLAGGASFELSEYE